MINETSGVALLNSIAVNILYEQNEQLKRKLIKLAHEADMAKWARLKESEK